MGLFQLGSLTEMSYTSYIGLLVKFMIMSVDNKQIHIMQYNIAGNVLPKCVQI
jgi:hypothetical protein